MTGLRGILGQGLNLKFHKVKLLKFQGFNFDLKLEGQGRGIIMGVTRLFLLGPFYSIQTNFLYFFAHDCIRKSSM